MRRIEGGGGTIAVVVMVPVEVCVPVAVTATLGGENTQLVRAGAPVQVRETVPVKPFSELSVAVTVPLLPGTRVRDVGAMPSAKSGVPAELASETVWGLLASLSATLRVADSATVVEPVKVTEMVQFAPAASEAPQVLV